MAMVFEYVLNTLHTINTYPFYAVYIVVLNKRNTALLAHIALSIILEVLYNNVFLLLALQARITSDSLFLYFIIIM